MKKVVAIILFFLIVLGYIPVYAVSGFYLIKVNASLVNVRSGPAIGNKILYQTRGGSLLELLLSRTNSSGEKWYRVYDFDKNKVGYIASWLTDNTNIRVQGEDADFKAEVTADVLNVRIGPGTGFNVVDVLSSGNIVHIKRIIKRSDGETWYRYQDKNGQYRYIAGWYTKKMEVPVEPPPDNNNKGSKAEALYYINLRKGPSLDYARIDLIEKGSSLPIVGVARNEHKEIWIEVQYKGKIGWVYSPLFKLVSPPTPDLSKIGSEGKIGVSTNLREGPSVDYSVQTVLGPGASGIVIGIAENEKKEIWYELNVIGKTGWVRSDLFGTGSKKKGEINKITWLIAPDGIDVVIKGNNLPNPSLSVLENPVRLISNFANTITENESALSINIPPIIRVRYEQSGNSVAVTADLNNRIPFQGERKDTKTFILHLKLPKKGEKMVDLSDTEIYAPVAIYNDKEYLELDDLLDCFGITPVVDNENVNVNLFGKKVIIKKSKLLEKEGKFFIPLDTLSEAFNVSVMSSSKTIYIDPVLEKYEETDGKLSFTFSIPSKVKKEKGDSLYLIFYANPGAYNMFDSKKRDDGTPPEIKIRLGGVDKNVDITTKDNKTVVSLDENGKGTLSGRIIILDPGHGSYSGPYLDTGATGPTGVKEGAVVLEIAKRLRKLLEADGAKVILTHEVLDDINNPTLSERCAIANNSGGDLFMSIHLNASVSRVSQGTETYYWHSDSYDFAKAIQDALISNLNTTDRGVKRDYLYVCRNVTTMPAILAEIVFVSNPKEEALCKDSNFLDKVAEALKEGIEKYLNG